MVESSEYGACHAPKKGMEGAKHIISNRSAGLVASLLAGLAVFVVMQVGWYAGQPLTRRIKSVSY